MEWSRLVPELTVSDFDASLRFYTEVLGFQIMYRREDPAFAYLDLDGIQFMLEAFQEDGWNTGILTKPYGRGVNFQIELADIQPVLEALELADYPLFRPVAEGWYETAEGLSGQKEFLVQDPDGYLLRFCQDLGEKPPDKKREANSSFEEVNFSMPSALLRICC